MNNQQALAIVEGASVGPESSAIGTPETLESDGPVMAYTETAILELAHVAAWLRVSERTVERLDIPFALLGKRTKRYLAKDVLDYIARRRVA